MTWVAIGVGGASLLTSVAGGRSAERKQKKLEEQAAAEEAARKQQIEYATASIDAAFDAPQRHKQYSDYLQAMREYMTRDLEAQKADVDRQTTFSLARSGLAGGSADVDARRLDNEQYLRGVLNVERRAQDAVGDVRSADQQARLGLINAARGGLDATTAARRASEALNANFSGAIPNLTAQGLGDVFAQSIGTAQRSREASERRRALGHRADIYSAGGL